MYCQHLLHQLSVLWSELASEDGIPLGTKERGGEGTRGEGKGGEVHMHNSYITIYM